MASSYQFKPGDRVVIVGAWKSGTEGTIVHYNAMLKLHARKTRKAYRDRYKHRKRSSWHEAWRHNNSWVLSVTKGIRNSLCVLVDDPSSHETKWVFAEVNTLRLIESVEQRRRRGQ